MPQAELEDVASAALAELERRRAIHLKPHRVHQKGALVALPDEIVDSSDDPDEDGYDPRPRGSKVTGSRYAGALSCPDCNRGLVGRGEGMACSQIPVQAQGTQPCHPGCIVACGEGK